MRKTLLLATLLVASVFTAKAQLTLSNSAEVLPRSDWYADLIPYDMTVVAQALGFADAAELDQALLGYVKGENNDFTITNISKAGNETTTNTGDAANYWHWDNTIEDWVYVTRGCFWLDVNGEEVGWTSPAYYWTEVDWNVDNNELYIGIGQNAYLAGGGLPEGTYVATTRIEHGGASVTFITTLVVKLPEGLPVDPVTNLNDLSIVKDVKVEVTQPVMLDWGTNPTWEVDGTELINAFLEEYPEFDLSLINANMAQVYWAREWDNASDELSTTLSNNHAANAHGFWMAAVVDGETGLKTEYCVPNSWTGSEDFFTENIQFNTETYAFSGASGQNPNNKFKGGEHFQSDMYFVLGSKALHVEFHFNVEKEAEIPIDEMVKVGETTMTWVQEPRTSTAGLKKFIPNYAEVLELLGCNEAAIRYKLYQPDNTLDDATNTENNGFWVDAAGYKTVTEEGKQAFYIDYAADVMALSVGQYPNVFAAGDEMLATVWLCNKEKYYQVNVMLHVQDLTKVETTEYHEVASYNYAVRSLIDGAWDATEKFIEGLPMAEIEEALGTNDFVVYAKQPGDIWSTGYTCTPYPGFWYTVDGNVVGWNEAHIGLRFERDYLVVHKNPQMTDWAVGNKYNHSIYLVNEVTGAYVTFNVQVTIVSEIVNYTDVGSKDVTVYVDPNVDDGWGMNEVEAADMFEALGIAPDSFWGGDVEVQLPIDDDMYASFDTDFTSFDYFFSADGKGVHTDGTVYSFEVTLEQGADATTMTINANVSDFDPENLDGQERTTTIALIKGSKRYFLNVRMFYGLEDAITAVEAQQQKTGAVYTLAGQRVNAPVRGLYIQNGKKIFVK